ncbi:MAG: PAS domain-containing sensor histidine kinase, partial [Caulobacteraceae bacterium]
MALESLRAAGLVAQIHENLTDLCGALEIGGAVLVMAEEATVATELDTLTRYLARQPPWSDLPVILITGRGGGPERNPAATRLGEVL